MQASLSIFSVIQNLKGESNHRPVFNVNNKQKAKMNIDSAFPSKYMKAADLPEETVVPFVIEEIKTEEIGKEKQIKPVIYFKDQDKGFVANKTNCNTIAKVLGSRDTDDWTGKTIRLYRTEVQFGDEMVESIRVSLKAGKGGTASPAPAPKEESDNDEIPF